MSKSIGFIESIRNRREYGEKNPWKEIGTEYVYEIEEETEAGYFIEYYEIEKYRHKYTGELDYGKFKYNWASDDAQFTFNENYCEGQNLKLGNSFTDSCTVFEQFDEETHLP